MAFIDVYNTNEKYDVIYADPPWKFLTYSNKGLGKSAEQHYDTMTFQDICDMPIKDIANKDCVLLIWTIDSLLLETQKVIEAWGFEYKTMGFVWVKTNKKSDSLFWGMGYWGRANTEYCLLATRGKPKRYSKGVHKVIMDKIREHSRKPDCMYDKIEQLLGKDTKKIELFARNQYNDGWDVFGNQVDKFETKIL